MAGARRVQIRSFGSEVPDPSIEDLAGWVGKRKGIGGDLTSYLLEKSLEPQESVDLPCAGGRICLARVLETLRGIDGEILNAGPSAETALVEEDARWGASRRKGLAFALPAPSLLGIRDGFYHDREEFCEGMATAFRQILRAMRDAGAGGHVLLGEKVHAEELEHLAGPRIFFFYPELSERDLTTLLEYQDAVAVHRDRVEDTLDLLDEYDLRHIFIVDGKQEDLLTALEHLDPDQVSLGGYCSQGEDCGKYWTGLVERAIIPR
jgi:hypothetical protein